MPFPRRAPAAPRALLSPLTRTSAAAHLRPAVARQVRWETTEKKRPEEGRSFKGQLYQSTALRLQKEREDRERFAKQRNEGAGGRNAALTFGSSPPTFASARDVSVGTDVLLLQLSSQLAWWATT
jgi:D-lactate dehydrogenase (cytochrome)